MRRGGHGGLEESNQDQQSVLADMVAAAARDASKIKRRKPAAAASSSSSSSANGSAAVSSSSSSSTMSASVAAAARAAAAAASAAQSSSTHHIPQRAARVPVCWNGAPRLGNQIMACPLLVVKTPIAATVVTAIPPQHMFTPAMMVNGMKTRGLPLGLVIDLTDEIYYPSTDVEKLGVRYTKMPIANRDGNDGVPTNSEADAFVRVVRAFHEQPEHSELFIGVHDRLGFNASGTCIICFLVEDNGWPLREALAAYAVARPPGVFDPSCLAMLFQRYSHQDNNDTSNITSLNHIPHIPPPDWFTITLPTPSPPSASSSSSSSSSRSPVGRLASSPRPPVPTFNPPPSPSLSSLSASSASSSSSQPANGNTNGNGNGGTKRSASEMTSSSTAASATSTATASAAGGNRIKIPRRALANTSAPSSSSSSSSAPPAATSSTTSSSSSSSSASSSVASMSLLDILGPSTPSEKKAALAQPPAPSSPSQSSRPSPTSSSSLVPSSTSMAEFRRAYPFLQQLSSPSLERVQSQLRALIGDSAPLVGQLRTSLTSSHLSSLSNHLSYMVTWAPEGVTCVIYITRDHTYIAPRLHDDHSLSIWAVPNLHFPHRKVPNDRVDRTVAIGELVLDRGDHGAFVARLLITDMLIYSGHQLCKELVTKRLQAAEIELVNPLSSLRREEKDRAPLSVRIKKLSSLAKVTSVMDLQLPHTNTGVLFVPLNGAPHPSSLPSLLYWSATSSSIPRDRVIAACPKT